MMGYRKGARQQDINAIRRMSSEGISAEEISRAILVDLECVKSFINLFTKTTKTKVKKVSAEKQAIPEPPQITV